MCDMELHESQNRAPVLWNAPFTEPPSRHLTCLLPFLPLCPYRPITILLLFLPLVPPQSFQPECLYGSALLLAVVRDTRLSALAGWLPIAGTYCHTCMSQEKHKENGRHHPAPALLVADSARPTLKRANPTDAALPYMPQAP